MFCSRCGAAMGEGASFCAKCGQANPAATGIASSTPPPGFAPPPSAQQTSGLAIASLICGFLFIIFPAAVLAIVFGHIALSQIKKSAGQQGGRGIAIAGLVMGYLGVSIIPVLIIAAIAIPNLLRARIAANEASATASVRTIITAQVSYQSEYKNFAPTLRSLGGAAPCTPSPASACLIDEQLAEANSVPKNGYLFTVESSNGGTEFFVRAMPSARQQTGRRSFCAVEDNIVRLNSDGLEIPDRETCLALPPI